MEVETYQPIRAQDSVEDNDTRLDIGVANELQAYNGLQIDFESEFSDFLSRDVPRPAAVEPEKSTSNERRRGSNVSLGSLQTRLDYNIDGTINCCDINYNTIVSFPCCWINSYYQKRPDYQTTRVFLPLHYSQ